LVAADAATAASDSDFDSDSAVVVAAFGLLLIEVAVWLVARRVL